MRAREFLLEYNRDITKKNYGDKIVRRWGDGAVSSLSIRKVRDKVVAGEPLDANEQNVYNEAVNNIITKAELADPTPNKQYVQWLVRAWINGSLNLAEDILTTGSQFVKMWHELKTHRALPPKYSDINRIKARSDWNQAWVDIRAAYDKFAPSKPMAKGHAEELFNGPDVRIIRPHDEQAACYYGQGTQWCTAATQSHNMFNHYHSDGELSIFIPKKPNHEGEKYQLWVHNSNGSYQLMDEQDEPIEEGGIETLNSLFPSVTDKLLLKIHPGLVNHPQVNWQEYGSVKQQVVEKLLRDGYFKVAYGDLINMLDDGDDNDEDHLENVRYMKEQFQEMENSVIRVAQNATYDELTHYQYDASMIHIPNAIFDYIDRYTEYGSWRGDWADDEVLLGFTQNIHDWFNRQMPWDKRQREKQGRLEPYYEIEKDENTGKWTVEYTGP
jgi:hypothetical protein